MTRSRLLAGLAALVVAGPLAVATASPAGACSCARPDEAAAFETADAVFVAELETIHDARSGDSTNLEVAVLAVTGVYKGDVDELQGVATEASGASCGFEFRSGVAYLVFGTTDDDIEPEFYRVGLCNGTRALADGVVEFEATEQFPNVGGPPGPEAIQRQLGKPRGGIVPEMIIFGSVIVFVLAIASAFSLRDRRRAAARAETP